MRRMNCSRSCFRRLLGMLSLGITKRSRSGTFSPISCISPSTTHHSDFSSAFLNIAEGENLDDLRRLRSGRSLPDSVRAWRSCAAAIWRNRWGAWILLVRDSIGKLARVVCRCAKIELGRRQETRRRSGSGRDAIYVCEEREQRWAA